MFTFAFVFIDVVDLDKSVSDLNEYTKRRGNQESCLALQILSGFGSDHTADIVGCSHLTLASRLDCVSTHQHPLAWRGRFGSDFPLTHKSRVNAKRQSKCRQRWHYVYGVIGLAAFFPSGTFVCTGLLKIVDVFVVSWFTTIEPVH